MSSSEYHPGTRVSQKGETMGRTMSQGEFCVWADQLQLTALTRSVIQEIRTTPPSRVVKSSPRHSNVCGNFPSRKMGLKLQFESRTIELPFL
jgi:putative transposase